MAETDKIRKIGENVRLLGEALEVRRGFKWKSYPYDAIKHAYLRIEEVKARMCCATMNLDPVFLMLRTKDDALLKVNIDFRDKGEEILAAIREKNPKAEIGYHKNA
ncbi:MAG: hypothetical protein LBQ95_06660 [Lachnospiraceae bacterium]|jgi:hypothetical protein|nr:hypothetical protein [Lachnospiraceae bacterium]